MKRQGAMKMVAANQSTQVQQDPDPDDQDKVILSGTAPQTVWVQPYDSGTQQRVEFATSKDGPWYRQGIKWMCPNDSDDSMFILFQLVDVLAVECDDPLLYSPPFGSPLQQYCAIPASKYKTIYHFVVKHSAGVDIDPKIVVTPITE